MQRLDRLIVRSDITVAVLLGLLFRKRECNEVRLLGQDPILRLTVYALDPPHSNPQEFDLRLTQQGGVLPFFPVDALR